MRKLFAFIMLSAVALSSCTPVVNNIGDEIRLNLWTAELRNGSEVKLCFENDDADFTIANPDKEACAELKGLCVIDGDELMIYNRADGEPYIFKYKLKGDRLILEYGGGKLRLSKN